MENRHYFLGLALLATIAAALYPLNDVETELVETSVPRMVEMDVVNRDFHHKVVLTPKRWELEKVVKDLFYVKPKVIVVPIKQQLAPVVIAPPPQPVAPPLPFVYLGKMLEDGKITVFVTNADRSYALKGGEVIDGVYSVLSVDIQKVIFQYMPLKTEQVLIFRGLS